MSEIGVTETEARKMQIVTSITQSFFMLRLEDVDQGEFELDADSKLFLLENLGIKVSQMSLGLMSAERVEVISLLADGTIFESDASVYRPNDIDALARFRVTNLREDFSPGDLLMVVWSSSHSKATLLNLTSLSDIQLANNLPDLLVGPKQVQSPAERMDGLGGSNRPDGQAVIEAGSSNSESAELETSEQGSPPTQEVEQRSPIHDNFDPVSEIWARAYGGNSAAVSPWASPIDTSWLGASSPGLSEIEELAISAIREGKDQVWIFLVGGPGSGKSSYASQLLSKSGYALDGGALHLREYLATHPTFQPVRFVNDATVREKGTPASLVRDMAESAELGYHLLTCVNRGVLADELNLGVDGESEFASILDWMVGGSDSEQSLLMPIVQEDYIQVGKQDLASGQSRYVVVVYMDVASLLEDQPKVTHAGTFDSLSCEVLNMKEHSEDSLLGSQSSPFSLLLERVAGAINPEYLKLRFGLSDLNPVLANSHQLLDGEFRRGLISILRASEIRIGSRLNYRALWSITARLLFGDLPSKSDFLGLGATLSRVDRIAESSTSFSDLMDLTSIRATEALFENRKDLALSATFDPGLRFTLSVDPAIATSGEVGSKSNSTSDQAIFVKPIAHAFQSAEVGEGILDTISMQTGNPLPTKKTAFDSKLDSLFALNKGAESTQRLTGKEVARYSRYLLRISSVYGAICHGKREALEWAAMWNFSPHIPSHDDFTKRIDSLVKPKLGRSELQQTALISLLESRARPIVQTSESAPIFSKNLDNVQFSTQKVGPDLFLVLKEFSQELGRLKIDYSFLREVLNTSPYSVGVTEETHYLSPRLERTRSVKLLSQKEAQSEHFAVVIGDRVITAFADRKGGKI